MHTPTGDAAAAHLAYRPDIDGLRAVAVILVVLFHLGVGFTKGGFVGVDVFFVISGFLISSIIRADVAQGTYSLASFYERRIRRLFPALFAVLLASTVAALALMFPADLEEFGKTLAAAAFFSANFIFAARDTYFGPIANSTPLLHTWSLAVEEQFYLVFPLLFAPVVLRHLRATAVVVAAVAAASFLASVVVLPLNQMAAFYLFPLRAWELLLGVLVALAPPCRLSGRLRDGLGLAGLLAVCAAAGAYNRNVPFPGASALVPCLGTALLIWTGRDLATPVARALAAKPLVGIGLISYSLYVWHFPIIVFYKLAFVESLSKLEMAGLGLASLAVAALSWRYIELPTRQRRTLGRRPSLFAGAAAAIVGAIALGGLLLLTQGFARSYPDRIRQLAAFRYAPDAEMRTGTCFITRGTAHVGALADGCLALAPARPNILIVGDSHAAHLWSGLAATFPDANFLQATASGCKPLTKPGGAPRCRRVMDFVFAEFLPRHRLDAIIVSADWRGVSPADMRATAQALQAFARTVYVFGPIVEYDDILPRLLLRSAWRAEPAMIKAALRPDVQATDAAFAAALAGTGVTYVSVYDVLCAQGCVTTDARGEPIQFDNAHLTASGSRLLAERLRERGLFPHRAAAN